MPSLLNVAECQYEKLESDAASRRAGMRRVADVEQEPVALARAARQTDLRIHRDVVAARAQHARPLDREPRIDNGLQVRAAAPRCPPPSERPCRLAPSRRCPGCGSTNRRRTSSAADHRRSWPRIHREARPCVDIGDILRRQPVRAGTWPRPSKIRGELTIAACSGCASGTLMTSIRNFAEFGSWSGLALTQPASSLGERTADEPEM